LLIFLGRIFSMLSGRVFGRGFAGAAFRESRLDAARLVVIVVPASHIAAVFLFRLFRLILGLVRADTNAHRAEPRTADNGPAVFVLRNPTPSRSGLAG